jgi:5-methylcytosine-specific restriction endonuclease McrA
MSAYPAEWPQVSYQAKVAAGWRCVRCGHPTDKPGKLVPCDALCTHPREPIKQRMLTVHHLDGNKANLAWWNLAALCQVCHLRIQGKVIMSRVWMFEHSEWFKPYIAGYYAQVLGLCIERDYVLVNLELLIALGQYGEERLNA